METPIPVLNRPLDEPLHATIPGTFAPSGNSYSFEVIPAFRIASGDLDSLDGAKILAEAKQFRISLDEPDSGYDKIVRFLDAQEVIRPHAFHLVVESPESPLELTSKEGVQPATIRLSIEQSDGNLLSQPLRAKIHHIRPKRAFLSIIFLGDITCHNIWGIRRVMGKLRPLTACIGVCLPFFKCRCFDPFSRSFEEGCLGWWDCECLPGFLLAIRRIFRQ